MSRTDNTRPVWVRMADAPMTTCVPVHDHRFGPCTLPAEITGSPRRRGCYWAADWGATAFRRTADSREWAAVRREDRRRSRHQARRELRCCGGEG